MLRHVIGATNSYSSRHSSTSYSKENNSMHGADKVLVQINSNEKRLPTPVGADSPEIPITTNLECAVKHAHSQILHTLPENVEGMAEQYKINIKLLNSAITVQNDEVIQALIPMCQYVPKTSIISEEIQYRHNSHLLMNAVRQNNDQAIDALTTMWANGLSTQNYTIEDLKHIKPYEEDLKNLDLAIDNKNVAQIQEQIKKLLGTALSTQKNQFKQKIVEILIKECAYALEAQNALVKSSQIIFQSTDQEPDKYLEEIDRYSKNLQLLQSAILKDYPQAVEALAKICQCKFNAQEIQGIIKIHKGDFEINEDSQDIIDISANKMERYLPLLQEIINIKYYDTIPTLIKISTDKNKRNLLHDAIILDAVKIARFLIKYGAERATPDIHGMTPLHYAAQFGDLIVVKALLNLEVGAEDQTKKIINALDLKKRTPLFLAARYGHEGIVQFLLKKGANNLPARDGRTPYSIADQYGYINIVEMFNKAMEPTFEGVEAYMQKCYTYAQGWHSYAQQKWHAYLCSA